ncbi:glycoside hydrolase family 2 protein [Methylovorus glucosotrophus]|uniref:Glycoside hydrolase family 2 sugar binding n=1 Tax=Methylovorus glucosotrophus (strain SIP3-4) TaxID=582744 RepID=C6X7L8_METGS|nr:glycoside hydrolase family 2 [Methylovorus glucosotrophus]ACT49260.1 glycoside hydrolase family 2 sugar binding [Methylovorus glucosotrophus SIP3-4]
MIKNIHNGRPLGPAVFFLMLMAACWLAINPGMAQAAPSSGPQVLDLSGSWQFMPTNRIQVTPSLTPPAEGWRTINVPDNWFRQGQDISGQAWYSTRFKLDDSMRGKHAELKFEGVDYLADVWVNGQYLGHHEGYFQPFSFDITPHLRDGDNVITVLVDSPLEKPEDWSLHKRLVKGIFSHHDTRPGGAWSVRGQEQNTGGIWAPVSVAFSDQLAIQGLKLTPRRHGNAWRLDGEVAVAGDVSHETLVQVEAELVPENFAGRSYRFAQPLKLKPGSQTFNMQYALTQPELWWPADYGKPNLYRFKLRITNNGRVLDSREQVLGLREIRVDETTQQWYINNHRMFIRGTNYIGSQWLAEMTPDRYERDIRMMRDAHVNAIRVHAHIASAAFYDACDRNGMLVMQDFPLLWGYSDDEAFHRTARAQAADMVRTLYHHPSVVSWTMHNEPPWDSPWMVSKYPDYRADQNLALDNALYQDVRALDDTRITRRESGTKEHEWLGWYSDNWHAFARPAPNPWITEFGAQALPVMSSLQRLFTDAEMWPQTEPQWEKWQFHNFQPHETFNIAHVPRGNNVQELMQNTQAYQSRLIQFAAENYRRQRYAPVSAIFQFMFVENWPSINWGVVDYWRQPKPGYEALRTAFQPVLPSLQWVKDQYASGETIIIGLWAINDLWQPYPQAKYTISLLRDGQAVDQREWMLDMAADSGKKLEDYRLEQAKPGQYELQAELQDSQGKRLGSNRYRFTVAP